MKETALMQHSRPGDTSRLALLVVLASETIFFGTLLSAYFYLRASQASWPLPTEPLDRLLLPAANTFLLLFSVLAVNLALRSIRQGNFTGLRTWLVATLLSGLVFVAGQIFDFTHSGMKINDQAFGGVFFTLMGFHAVHVLAGLVFISLILVRAFLGDFTHRRYLAVQVGAWFWDFIVGVWVVLFAALYLV
jgi:cytochrome c oxidase subunit 3